MSFMQEDSDALRSIARDLRRIADHLCEPQGCMTITASVIDPAAPGGSISMEEFQRRRTAERARKTGEQGGPET